MIEHSRYDPFESIWLEFVVGWPKFEEIWVKIYGPLLLQISYTERQTVHLKIQQKPVKKAGTQYESSMASLLCVGVKYWV